MTGATEKNPEILTEWTLLPQNTAKLQVFLAANIDALRRGNDPMVKQALQALIRDTFPKEALDDLAMLLSGNSDHAVLIHGLPEIDKTWVMKREKTAADETYGYHIGQALYEINGVRSSFMTTLRRSPYESDSMDLIAKQSRFAADILHCDRFLTKIDGQAVKSRFLALHCPVNAVKAPTEIVAIKKALASERNTTLPTSTKVKVRYHQPTEAIANTASDNPNSKIISLNDLKRMINEEPQDPLAPHIDLIASPRLYDDVPLDEKEMNEIFVGYRKPIILEHGDLLLIDQDGPHAMFHRANPGSPEAIDSIPYGTVTGRVIVHHTGAPMRGR